MCHVNLHGFFYKVTITTSTQFHCCYPDTEIFLNLEILNEASLSHLFIFYSVVVQCTQRAKIVHLGENHK
jgi:hypothetical protein